MPAVPRRVGLAGPHARRVCGGRGGAERRRLDLVRLNSAIVRDNTHDTRHTLSR